MKVHKITVMVVDHDDIGPDDTAAVLENARYPNHCISPRVINTETRDIGEWDDGHPLNSTRTFRSEFERLFAEAVANAP